MTADALDPVSLRLAAVDFARFSAELGASFERFGFAVIGDHGLDERLIAAAMADAKAFFALPPETKRRYQIPGGAGQRGYTPFAVETAVGESTPDLKEFWHLGREPPLDPAHPLRRNVWPEEAPGFRVHLLALYAALEDVGQTILAAVGRHLGLERGRLENAAHNGDSILRLLHYPPRAFEGPGLRAGPHEDVNAITLLLGAEEAGLEILGRDGTWLAIDPPPGALVVNIGDTLARLTNDVLPSTTHRVANPAADRRAIARYSTPFFLHFRPDFLIETLPQCVSPERPNRFPEPITARDFLARRLKEIRLA